MARNVYTYVDSESSVVSIGHILVIFLQAQVGCQSNSKHGKRRTSLEILDVLSLAAWGIHMNDGR